MKPMLFNTDMVRAMLDGRKCVTRRIIKPQPRGHAALISDNLLPETGEAGAGTLFGFEDGTVVGCPFKKGDILYVRETWAITSRIRDIADDGPVYMADLSEMELRYLRDKGFKWRPSIHMPKDIARIFLRVMDVRAERLQAMEVVDFVNEGIQPRALKAHGCECAWKEDGCRDKPCANRDAYERLTYAHPFGELWDSTLKPAEREKYGWKANPWVWVIRFEQIEKPKEE